MSKFINEDYFFMGVLSSLKLLNNINEFNVSMLTYASPNCIFSEYTNLLKGEVVNYSKIVRFTQVNGTSVH